MWSFYFHELMRSLPFFLKGVWMTIAVAGLSLVFGTIIGFIAGILRAGRNKPARYIVGVFSNYKINGNEVTRFNRKGLAYFTEKQGNHFPKEISQKHKIVFPPHLATL